jgi:hypothetical protein
MKMRKLKILGLMVVAAAVLMATLGATTASATETALCKEKTTFDGLPRCEGGHLYKAGQIIHAVSETFVLIEAPWGNIECEESTIEASTEKATGIPLG